MRIKFAIIAIASLFAASAPAAASVNMHIAGKGSSQVSLKLSTGNLTDDVDTITATGSAPYFRTRGLIRDLAADEVYLTFEYTSSADVQNLKFIFTPPRKRL